MNSVQISLYGLAKFLTATAVVSSCLSAQAADLGGCGAKLKAALCYTDPVSHWTQTGSGNVFADLKAYQDRKCLPAPADKFKAITEIYEMYPVEVQKAFCEMKRVFLVRGNVPFGAGVEYYFEPATVKIVNGEWNPKFTGTPTGYVLEISEQNRFKDETSSFYISRVMQARYGQVVARDGLAKDLPLAEYTTPFGNRGALATTIIHEIGHMLSRAHKVTDIFFLPKSETAWSRLSWSFDGDAFASAFGNSDFESRSLSKQLTRADIRTNFEYFKSTGTPTLYAGTNVEEEFAEIFMFHFYDDLKWKSDSEVVYDLKSEFQTTAALKAKRDFIKALLAKPKPFSLEAFGAISGEIPVL